MKRAIHKRCGSTFAVVMDTVQPFDIVKAEQVITLTTSPNRPRPGDVIVCPRGGIIEPYSIGLAA